MNEKTLRQRTGPAIRAANALIQAIDTVVIEAGGERTAHYIQAARDRVREAERALEDLLCFIEAG